MIKFNPSKGVIDATGIDFDLLSFILARVFPAKFTRTLRVEKARNNNNYSGYYPDTKIIRLFLRENRSLRYVIATILHELRHYFQIREYEEVLELTYESYQEYYNSPEEIDARKFEKLTGDICKIYRAYKSIEEKIKYLGIDSFKELGYNLGVDSNKLK
jgi:hypothetical protein